MEIIWNDGDRNFTGLVEILTEVTHVDAAITKLEAAAGVQGDWDYDDDWGASWWGLVGTFGGEVFTVYTHKSGTLKIGAKCFDGALDIAGVKAAILRIVA